MPYCQHLWDDLSFNLRSRPRRSGAFKSACPLTKAVTLAVMYNLDSYNHIRFRCCGCFCHQRLSLEKCDVQNSTVFVNSARTCWMWMIDLFLQLQFISSNLVSCKNNNKIKPLLLSFQYSPYLPKSVFLYPGSSCFSYVCGRKALGPRD